MSLLLTLNVFYIFHDLENVEKRALYWKKGKKRKFNRLQIEVPFLPSISLPPPPPEYRLIKFFLCPYIRPGRIDRILQDLTQNFHHHPR